MGRSLVRKLPVLIITGIALLIGACGHYITVTHPPVIDLRNYSSVAVVDFPVHGRFPNPEQVTRLFLTQVYSAQPGVRILEIGPPQQVLRQVGGSAFDPLTIRRIGVQYGVDAVLTGEMNLALQQPSISLDQNLTRVDASSKVRGELNGKLQETASGATVWSNGAHGTWTLGGVSVSGKGLSNLVMDDLSAKYDAMLRDLAHVATNDFRPTYERRKVD